MYKMFLSLIFLIVLTFLGAFLFKIQKVEVAGGRGCVDESAVISQFKGKNILTVLSKQAQKIITEVYK